MSTGCRAVSRSVRRGLEPLKSTKAEQEVEDLQIDGKTKFRSILS